MDEADATIAGYLEEFAKHVDSDTLVGELGLFCTPIQVARQSLLTSLYHQIRTVPGDMVEFGCRYGKNIALFAALRRMHEIFDNRHIIGFDTFQGLPTPDAEDGNDKRVKAGNYGVPDGYYEWLYSYLNGIMKYRNLGLFRGDVAQTWPEYLSMRPECMVALAYFDLDLYAGTRSILPSVWERMPKGAVLVMDELNCHHFPGETIAVRETVGLDLAWRRDPTCNFVAWTVKS